MRTKKHTLESCHLHRRYTSVQWRLVKHRHELSIPLEGDWMLEWGFKLGSPLEIAVREERMFIQVLPSRVD